MVYIIALSILTICILAQVLIVKRFGITGLFNNPISISIFFFELIHLFMPVLQWYAGYFRYAPSYDEFYYSLSLVYCGFLFVVYIFIFFYKFDYFVNSREGGNLYLTPTNSNRFLVFSWIVLIVGIYFSFKNILNINAIGVDSYLKDRIGFSAGQGYKILFSHWTYISCILFYLGYLISDKKKVFFLSFIFSLIYCFIYYSVNSNRNSLFVLVISLVVFYLYFKKGERSALFSKLIKAFSLSIFIFAFYLIGKFRTSSVNSNQDDYGFIHSLNGAFGNHENIAWLFENDYGLLLGQTYLASFLNLIPRSLWEDKPFGAGPELKNMIYPGSYVLGQEGNSSLTTGLFTETLMNFGIIGSFPAVFLIAFFIFIILAILRQMKNPIGKILYIYLFMLFSTQFFYAEFLGFYTRTLFTCIPIILLAFFVKFNRKEH